MSRENRARNACCRFALVLAALILFSGTAIAQYNLVQNGNFEGGFVADGNCDVIEPDADMLPNSWTCFETYSGNRHPETSLIASRADNGPSGAGASSVSFTRLDQCNLSGDWTTIEQVIDQDITSCSSLTLSMDVKLLPMVGAASHNLGGSGHMAGSCDASGFEYPVTVKIDYLDANNQQHCWQYGWYQYSVTQANRTDAGCGSVWDGIDAAPQAAVSRLINANVWVANNFNLKSVLTNVKRLKKVRLGGSGWSFEGAVDNVKILCANSCATSPYPTCASATCPTGQKCQADAGAAMCECKSVPCSGTSPPSCGGTCPTGQTCMQSGSTCTCVNYPCGNTYPQCSGYCPTGMGCYKSTTGASCYCDTLSCEASPYPQCGGPCPYTGQTCVVGPGNECMCTGPPCTMASAPLCGGTCPAGQQCHPDTVGTGCICENVVCEQSGYPQCDGQCPTDYLCTTTLPGNTCYCKQVACEASSPPQCGGSCPTGQNCVQNAAGDGCHCETPPCEQTLPPTCGGTCPAPLICDISATGTCGCRHPTCTETSPPQCGGECPTGETCIADPAGNGCFCQTLCAQTQPPQCGGWCPAGEQCEPDSTGAGCTCQTPCANTLPPQCGGWCPVGETCTQPPGSLTCLCEPISIPCANSPYPQCNGTCPDPQVCGPNASGTACQCQVPDHTIYKAPWPDYAPSGMPDFEQNHNFLPQPPFPPVNPRRACGPTAMLNSLWWFDSEMECDTHHTKGDAAESEPNDNCNLADTLGETPPVKGNVAGLPPPLDVDWYTFVVPPGGVRDCTAIISTFALAAAGDADTKITLYNSCDATGPGVPIAENDDAWGSLQSEIAETLKPGRYWVRVMVGHTGVGGNYTLTLGLDCYPLLRRWTQWAPDDHSPYNVEQLIASVWTCSNTDDLAGGGRWKGTRLPDMKTCADLWINAQGLDPYYTRGIVRAPTFAQVAKEVLKSEDVMLLLGFYWQAGPGAWIRCGGHYVTAAGVDTVNSTITVSDPYYNNAEPPPAGNSGAGQVLGPSHTNHAPGLPPPPDHDDAVNVSHDRYARGPSAVGGAVSNWSLTGYATAGTTTTCEDVLIFCGGSDWGQNPLEYPSSQAPCQTAAAPVSVEVEAMVDVSPLQTPVCVSLSPLVAWPNNLMVAKTPCEAALVTPVAYDFIRGKHCGIKDSPLLPQVDLGNVQCLANDALLDRFDEISPDYDFCTGPRFYLIRQSTDANYGAALPGGEPELPSSGGCP